MLFSGTEEDSEGESSEYEKNLANIASGLGHNGDFFFGDGDNETLSYSLGINVRNGEVSACILSESLIFRRMSLPQKSNKPTFILGYDI